MLERVTDSLDPALPPPFQAMAHKEARTPQFC